MPDTARLQQELGIEFTRPALLDQALVHSSYINENPAHTLGHNERLEFLGDAVLDFIVADRLYRQFPELAEGEMTRLRASLVRRETLAAVARKIKLGDYLYMGKGEESSGGRNKVPNLAGAFESLIAAVFLDRGIAAVAALLDNLMAEEWARLGHRGAAGDFKSRLQEFTQSRYQSAPVYRLAGESGPDHAKSFSVEVLVNARVMGRATGSTKKAAETEAARIALERLAGGFTG